MSAQVYPDLNNYRPQSVCGLVYTRADLLTIGSTLGYQQVIDDFGLHTIRTNHAKWRCFRRRGTRGGVRKRRQIQVISGKSWPWKWIRPAAGWSPWRWSCYWLSQKSCEGRCLSIDLATSGRCTAGDTYRLPVITLLDQRLLSCQGPRKRTASGRSAEL